MCGIPNIMIAARRRSLGQGNSVHRGVTSYLAAQSHVSSMGVSIQRVSVQEWGFSVQEWGFSVEEWGFSVQGGGSLSSEGVICPGRGVLRQGGVCPGWVS